MEMSPKSLQINNNQLSLRKNHRINQKVKCLPSKTSMTKILSSPSILQNIVMLLVQTKSIQVTNSKNWGRKMT